MTIATHEETFRMPFGQVVVEGSSVVDLLEKPQTRYRISSGTYVLAAGTVRSLAPPRAVGAPELFRQLREAGRRVAAFAHQAPWIDVNDAAALREAEALVDRHHGVLDCLFAAPDRHCELLLAPDASTAWLGQPRAPASASAQRGCHAAAAIDTLAAVGRARLIGAFDEADVQGCITRFHLFQSMAALAPPADFEPLTDDGPAGRRVLARCLAYARRQAEVGRAP